ncbi:aminotransferase class I/II-fold pyridoxal phosphate-dependent enzyme [Nocardioides sp. zg-579]|uniref:Aminotransferase n=1 Tax=Nocardioides marmotae TaxID=2663857 RepID=A0A6I3JDW5_9ACTN|nr:aminotransferase class I/II-fold pyridoxal phosphate-dependent enzyme [Gordonia jinghuaiqii]MTB96233.1 aminotransferase class I/II-fold pyridoxal phosphate-dependent enzyme [Nocardioides marmotae]
MSAAAARPSARARAVSRFGVTPRTRASLRDSGTPTGSTAKNVHSSVSWRPGSGRTVGMVLTSVQGSSGRDPQRNPAVGARGSPNCGTLPRRPAIRRYRARSLAPRARRHRPAQTPGRRRGRDVQALILAAGVGRRLGRLTRDRTKCMVEVHGRTLLERSLDALVDNGIERVVIVVGHRGQGVRDAIGSAYRGVPVTYVENADHATTNNIHSLYLAAGELAADDTLLLESDLIFEPRIIERLLAHPAPDVAAVAAYRSWMDGTMVTLGRDEVIEAFVPKHLVDGSAMGQYFKTVNIYKLSQEFIKNRYLPFLEAYVRSVGPNDYYEQVLRVIAGLDHHGLVGMPLEGEAWYEIDDVQDHQIAETLFAPAEERYDHYLRRHGGFWRFPGLLDFCYLVNPYFPTPALRQELARSFDTLLTEYPSCSAVQNHLAAKMFGGEPDCFLVGNGAAELIAALGEEVGARTVGVTVPTFEEYVKRFPHAEVVAVRGPGGGLETDLEHYLRLLERVDLLVLVNPDNPSGRCLRTEEVLTLLDRAERSGKRVLLDESFVDFADPAHATSLLRQDVLDAHPAAVVVKSISKSYGVPGARLGVLATRDADLLGRVARRLSVWNVNSVGEYFLQVIGHHQAAYVEACARLRAERDHLTAELAATDGLRVLPSQANYLLCEVTTGASGADIVSRLLGEHRVLVKDCAGKPGFEGLGPHLRIAVRDRADNEVLVHALRSVLAAAG